ncbi:MAG: hypothetical protein IT350_00540 [Deltaproteobacteria bacterium]|nr:hypothetical protein [Deltaproteobacteria bacterium]
MKSRRSFLLLLSLASLVASASCFTADDSDEDSCVDTKALSGQTFETGAGTGVFAFASSHACGEFFFTYRDGGLRLDRCGDPQHSSNDRTAYSTAGDVWIWNQNIERLTHLRKGELFDRSDWIAPRHVGDMLVTTTGVVYFLLTEAWSYNPVGLLKYDGENTEIIELPQGAWNYASISSHGDLLALVLITEYPEGAIFVLRQGEWEDGPAYEMPNDEQYRGFAIVGDGEYWMWTQAADAVQDGDPWFLNRHEGAAWTRIRQTDFRIRGVLTDGHERRVLWGDTSKDDELGGRTYGHGVFDVFEDGDWRTVTFDEVKWPSFSRAALDPSGAIWIAGSRHADSSQDDCRVSTVRLPFFSVYRDGAWTTPQMPSDVRAHLRDERTSDSCDAGE